MKGIRFFRFFDCWLGYGGSWEDAEGRVVVDPADAEGGVVFEEGFDVGGVETWGGKRVFKMIENFTYWRGVNLKILLIKPNQFRNIIQFNNIPIFIPSVQPWYRNHIRNSLFKTFRTIFGRSVVCCRSVFTWIFFCWRGLVITGEGRFRKFNDF